MHACCLLLLPDQFIHSTHTSHHITSPKIDFADGARVTAHALVGDVDRAADVADIKATVIDDGLVKFCVFCFDCLNLFFGFVLFLCFACLFVLLVCCFSFMTFSHLFSFPPTLSLTKLAGTG